MTHSRRNAFTLVELLVAIGLSVLVMDEGTRLLRSSVQLSAESARLSNQASQVDSALAQLRRDVWGSTQIMADAHAAALSQSDGSTIAWRLMADGSIQRIDQTSAARQWPLIGKDWSFSTAGSLLIVNDATSQGPRAQWMVSQVLMFGGAKP